jgi:uncharacterized protein YndB with AHSA1/START domain
MSTEDRRTIERTIEIDASADAVWKALSEARELVRWFPLQAETEPREGGRYWMSWGGAFEATSVIEIFEPGKHLRTTWPSGHKDGEKPAQLAVDYHLEGRGGGTVLRLVHSGFGRGASWDEEYEGVQNGWAFELRSLRHYLENHRGHDRHAVFVVGPNTDLDGPEVWRRVVTEGFGNADPAALHEGDRYSFPVGEGAVFEGTVLDHKPGRQLAMTVDGLDNGIFRIEVFAGSPHLWLATWGDPAPVLRFEKPWQEMLAGLFAGKEAEATS